jgi:hypothetical protein
MLSEATEEAFEHVKNEMMALNHVFVQDKFSIAQLGSVNAKYFFTVRDSIIYRTNSLRWHTHHLNSMHSSLEMQYHADFSAGIDTAQMLPSHQASLHYLFDDVSFGSISLLDYVANLVGLVFEGFAQRGKYKWNNAHKSAASNHGPLSCSETGNLIKQAHKDWVNGLQSYRGDLIHKHAILGDVSHQWKFDASGMQTSLRAAIPGNLQKLFADMSPSQGEHDLCSAAETIGVTTSNLSTKILSSLTTRIRANSDKAWIQDLNANS